MPIRSGLPHGSPARKIWLAAALALSTTVWLGSPLPAPAQTVVAIERNAPDRGAILDAERDVLEIQLGIKVKFVVVRLARYGDWVYAALRPRTAAGDRIDYRRTLYAKDYLPDMDSDHIDVLLKRRDAGWIIVEQAFLPTDVVWEAWQDKYRLPRDLFLSQ